MKVISLSLLLAGQLLTARNQVQPQVQQPGASTPNSPRCVGVMASTQERADFLYTKIGIVRPQNLNCDELDIRLLEHSSQETIAVDNSLFREGIQHSIDGFLRYLKTNSFPEAVRFHDLSPSAQDDIRSVLLRSPYAASWTHAYLSDPNATVGFSPTAMITLQSGDTKVTANIYRVDHQKQDELAKESKSNQDITSVSKSELNLTKSADEIGRRSPSRYVFRSLAYRDSEHKMASLLADYYKLVAKEFEKQSRKSLDEQEELARQWHEKAAGGAWPPRKGTNFADLDDKTKDLIRMRIQGSIAGSKFGNRAELDAFLNQCSVQSVRSDVSITMSNPVGHDAFHTKTFQLGAIR